MSIQPLVFTGISQYSSDFQSILNRAVTLAGIPLQQLQNQQSDQQQESTLAANLNSAVSGLASSIGSLGSIGDSRALTAFSSDSSIATATVTGTVTPTSYTISNVTSVARPASESSLQEYPDGDTTAVSTTGTVRLTVGANHFDLTLASGHNNLQGLRDAINGAGAGVTATILTTSTGNYLSVSTDQPGATTLALQDDPTGANTSLLTNTNQGANSVFQLNGVPVSEPATQINNVVPGLTITILGQTSGSQSTTISLQSDRSQMESALQSLATQYNAVAAQVNAQVGPNAGLLSGNPLIQATRSAMQNLVNFHGTGGSVSSLAELGITLSQSGQMSFDSTQLNGMSDAQLQDGFRFLSSAAGGLGKAQSAFTALSDPVSGAIQAQIQQYTTTGQRLSSQITDLTTRINLMQTTLEAELQAADASIAELQSQQNILTANITSLNYTSYGISPTSKTGG